MPIYLRFYIRNAFYAVFYSFIHTKQHTHFMYLFISLYTCIKRRSRRNDMVESTQFDDTLVSYDDSDGVKQPMTRIPFVPSFGEEPPMIVGRSRIIGQYDQALSLGDIKNIKQPLIVGAIATGKTVLLKQLIKQASKHVYAIEEYLPAQKGMYDQLMLDLSTKYRSKISSSDLSLLDEIGDENHEIKDKINEQHENNEYFDIDLATAIYSCCCPTNELIDMLIDWSGDSETTFERSNRLIIAIDDMNPAYIDDIRKIATTVQSLTEIGVDVIFIGTGTPGNIAKIKNDASATFIDKMDRIDIGNLPIKKAAESIEAVCGGSGIGIDRQVSMAIAKASDGEPFIMQLFACNACLMARRRDPHNIHVTMDDCYDGFEDGLSAVINNIIKPTLKTLTAKEIEFMKAMSSLYPTSKIKIEDIIKSTGKTKQYINIYKNRLIDKHIIKGDGHGYIKCVIPYMTMYLTDPEKYDNDMMGDMTDMDNDPTEWMRRPIKSTR